jgi:hypothetical protein
MTSIWETTCKHGKKRVEPPAEGLKATLAMAEGGLE